MLCFLGKSVLLCCACKVRAYKKDWAQMCACAWSCEHNRVHAHVDRHACVEAAPGSSCQATCACRHLHLRSSPLDPFCKPQCTPSTHFASPSATPSTLLASPSATLAPVHAQQQTLVLSCKLYKLHGNSMDFSKS